MLCYAPCWLRVQQHSRIYRFFDSLFGELDCIFGKVIYKPMRNNRGMQLWIIIASWLFLGLCKSPRIRHCGIPVQWTMTEHNYTRTKLLNLKACHQSTKPLGHGVWRTLCELGFSTRGPTPRGCRRGNRTQRNTDTVVGIIPTRGLQYRNICPENLMSLPRMRHQCFSSVPLDFCLLNPRSGSNKGGDIVEFVTENALVTSGTKSVRLVVVYRPPSKKAQSATAFLVDFALLLESLAFDSASLFMVGDFNIHMYYPTSRTGTANMLDLLAENDLTQLVHGPTNRGGGGGSHSGYYPHSGYRTHSIECAEQRPGPIRPQRHRLRAAHNFMQTACCQEAGLCAKCQAHHHIVSATALIHPIARPSISAMSFLLGISPKCGQLVKIWFSSHVAVPHIQCLFSR